MQQIAFVAPVLPGKEKQARTFFEALRGSRHAEYLESRRRIGIHERTYLQKTPQGEMVIVTVSGENPAAGLARFGEGTDDFTEWFVQQVKDLPGLDLRQPLPGELPELIVDSGSETLQSAP